MSLSFQHSSDGGLVQFSWGRVVTLVVLWLWRVTFESFLIGLVVIQLEVIWPRFGALGPVQFWLLAFAFNMFMLVRRFRFVLD